MFFKDKKKSININLCEKELSVFNLAKEKLSNVDNLIFPNQEAELSFGRFPKFHNWCSLTTWIRWMITCIFLFSKKLSSTITQHSTFRGELMAVYLPSSNIQGLSMDSLTNLGKIR